MRYIAEDHARRADARPRRTAVPFPTRAARRRRTRSPGAPARSKSQPHNTQVAQAVEHWADTVDTIDDKQIVEFDLAASGIGDDEFSDCMHQATFEGWEGRKAGTASEFIAIARAERRRS
jgi:hypothetical protein